MTKRSPYALQYPRNGVDAEDSPEARAELESRFLATWGREWASVAPTLADLARSGPQMKALALMNAESEAAHDLTLRAVDLIEEIRRWTAEHPGTSRGLETFPAEAFRWAEGKALSRWAYERPRNLFERALQALSPQGIRGVGKESKTPKGPFGRVPSDTEVAEMLLLLGHWPEREGTRKKSLSKIVAMMSRKVRAARARGIAEPDPNASDKPGRRRKK